MTVKRNFPMERQNNRCKWIIACVAIILLEASYSFAKTVNNYNQMSLKKITKECSQLRTGLLKDRYRLGYHIVAPEGICIPFDCNGAIFWNGRYHLMYLAGEKSMEWWHVSSHDLVHWRHHPPALGPNQGKGAWSGGIFVDKSGIATIT
jgi:sucrose-6-phosphate hydrolase SacC (GH32 family)